MEERLDGPTLQRSSPGLVEPEKCSGKGIQWDLRDLYESPSDPKLSWDEKTAQEEARRFAADYRGKIGSAGPKLMSEALKRYETLLDQAYRPLSYARLLHAADTLNPKHGSLLSEAQEALTAVLTRVMFFEVDWIAAGEEEATAVIESPLCARWRHFLSSLRRYRPHTLTEAEEIVLAEKAATGRSAFCRLFDEMTSLAKFEIELKGERKTLNQSEALALLYDADREVRSAAHAGFTKGLEQNSRLATFILNTVLRDHAVDNRLKHYTDPAESRHLANEIESESVEALMFACEKRRDMVQDYYRLKGRLLGVDPLYDYDRYAPVQIEGVSIPECDWQRACEMVHASFLEFSPVMGRIAREFLDKCWIDGDPRPGKRGGAFCSLTVPSVHPYILLNFTGKLNDAMTLAHELGHGVHQYLARPQGLLQQSSPLTLAETASVFGEMLVFDRLVKEQTNPKVRLALLCQKLEDSFATVFRQVVLTRFEQRIHSARAERELSTGDLDQLWLDSNLPMHGEVVKLTDSYKRWWSYIGHFIHSPFYCYAYSFGELLVLALWSQYRRQGPSFVPKYIELLKAGGSDTPARLVSKVGLDIKDPGFWDSGLSILEEILREAQRLARECLG